MLGSGFCAVVVPTAPKGAGVGSVPAPASNASIEREVRDRNRENVCFLNQKKNHIKKNTLWEIVEKCELYGQQGIEKIINGGRKPAGFGFG